MSTRFLLAASAVSLSMICAGCSKSGPALYPVHGTVTFQGKPAKGASVHFHREGETAEEASNFPMGVVDEDGGYTLEVHGVGRGAQPGKYKVLVRWSPNKDPDAPAPAPTASPATNKKSKGQKPTETAGEQRRDPRSAVDRLHFRYFRLDQPLLFAEVKPESNDIPAFNLEDGPPPAEEKKSNRRSSVTEDRG